MTLSAPTNGALIDVATASATVLNDDAVSAIEGTNGADNLVGTSEDDLILGKGGPDLIRALDGDDTVEAGAGWDDVRGGATVNKCRRRAGPWLTFAGARYAMFPFRSGVRINRRRSEKGTRCGTAFQRQFRDCPRNCKR